MNRKLIVSTTLAAGLLTAVLASSQAPSTNVMPFVMPNAGSGGTFVMTQNGQVDMNSSDTTVLLQQVLARNVQIQESDKKYVEETVKAINDDYTALMTYIVSGKFKQMADQSIHSHVDAKEFLSAVNDINQKVLALEARAFALTTIAGKLPSAISMAVGNNNQQIQGLRNIDMSPIVDFYTNENNGRIRLLQQAANNYKFKVKFEDFEKIQTIEAGQALSPSLEYPKFSKEEVEKMKEDRDRLLADSMKIYDLKNNHINKVKDLLNNFVQNYGQEETVRIRNGEDFSARQEAFDKLVEIFWSRSYLRAKYGAPLGTFNPKKYEKERFNLDKFKKVILNYREEAARTEKELDNAKEWARNYLIAFREKSLQFKDAKSRVSNEIESASLEKYVEVNAGLFSRANSFFSFVTMQTPLIEAYFMVTVMIAADIYEEWQLAYGGGRQAATDFYKKRFKSNDELSQKSDSWKCAYDMVWRVERETAYKQQCVNRSQDIPARISGSIREVFDNLNLELVDKRGDYALAQDLVQDIILASVSRSSSQVSEQEASIADDL